MSQRKKTKEAIVAEYLTGDKSYRELGIKYGIPYRSVCDWVLEYQGRKLSYRVKMKRKRERETGEIEPELPKEIKLLQQALRKEQLNNQLLEEIIRLSGKHTGIDLKKKFGTKQL